jgi:protein-tyrosine phosphatase
MRVLFVCTGNICRSPLAERLLRAWAAQELAAAAALVRADSAGTAATDGQPMDEYSAQALRELGGDPDGARARRLVPGATADADLVLTMTRRQRRSILHTDPRSLRRVFTLPEAAGLLALADPTGIDLVPLADRAAELAVRLDAARSHRPGGSEDDVRDPIGRSLEVHREVAARIAGTLRPLADVLFAPARAPRIPRRPTPVAG